MPRTNRESQQTATAHELVITRVIDAAPRTVFRAWIDPTQVVEWMAPRGFAIPETKGDPRPGGAWSMKMRSPQGENLSLRGFYREVEAPRRLSFTHAWLDESGRLGEETLASAELEQHGSGTRLTFRQSGFDSGEERDSHRDGWNQCFDRLEELLKRGA